MIKQFVDFYDVRDDSLIMADKILKDGFYPDIIYILLRGGAIVGNVISEYFKINRAGRKSVFYGAVAAKSYHGVGERSDVVKIEGWTYSPDKLKPDDKVLLIDDIFDSGNTINRVGEFILSSGISRDHLKVAVHDYKVKSYCPIQASHTIQPDYWAQKHLIERESDDIWLHYLSHELEGLTDDEKAKWLPRYPSL